MIGVEKVLSLQRNKVVQWHESLTLDQTELPWQFIEENHKWNFSLWHEEDVARKILTIHKLLATIKN